MGATGVRIRVESHQEGSHGVAEDNGPVVANALAVGTDGQNPFELLDLLAQPQDALRHPKTSPQLIRIDRFRDKIIGAATTNSTLAPTLAPFILSAVARSGSTGQVRCTEGDAG